MDPNLYYPDVEKKLLILVLYVDDLFLTGSSRLIGDCNKNLATEFDMKDLGQMHYFLGLEFWQQKGEIFLGQGRYAIEILKRFGMEDCRLMVTPMITNWKKIDASEDKDVDPTLYRQLIGSPIYLVNTRLDICHIVNTPIQFMVEPKRVHWAAAKPVLRYLQGTINYGLLYTKGKDINLSGFTDADWARSSVSQKSTSGRNLEAIKIMCDNQSCINLSENPVFHDRSKHIDIWCHFVRDCVQRGIVQLSYTPIGEQVVDILTKALGRTKFDYFRENMGMVKNPFQKKKWE
eukprot:PITA_33917